MACTLVTAFYPIRSKFIKEQYIAWASTFLRLETPVVLFTEESLVETFRNLRGGRPIHIVVLPFDRLDTWTPAFQQEWEKQHQRNPEGTRCGIQNGVVLQQTPELYAIWSHKSAFVERAIHINPFSTDYFFWCDIGAFRNPCLPAEILRHFPQVTHLPRDRILLQAMKPLPVSERARGADGIFGPQMNAEWNDIRLMGGLWGGGKEGCLAWKTAYDRQLQNYLASNRYAGNDQMVMLSTCLENPSLAIVVRPTRADIDQWFFLEYLLSSLAEYCIDESYPTDRATP